MKGILLLVTLLIGQLIIATSSVCKKQTIPEPVSLTSLPIKPNHQYTFILKNKQSPITMLDNQNGTFFHGDLSTLILSGSGSEYKYKGTKFSFKYPPQHRIAELTQQGVEMQIEYQLDEKSNSSWKHQTLSMSISFVVTEYAPENGFTLSTFLDQNMKNGSIVDLDRLLPLVPGLNMVLYKGIHSQYPEDKSHLWLVRRQLLLMSEKEFIQVKKMIRGQSDEESIEYHGMIKRLSDLNQIGENSMKQKILEQKMQL